MTSAKDKMNFNVINLLSMIAHTSRYNKEIENYLADR